MLDKKMIKVKWQKGESRGRTSPEVTQVIKVFKVPNVLTMSFMEKAKKVA